MGKNTKYNIPQYHIMLEILLHQGFHFVQPPCVRRRRSTRLGESQLCQGWRY